MEGVPVSSRQVGTGLSSCMMARVCSHSPCLSREVSVCASSRIAERQLRRCKLANWCLNPVSCDDEGQIGSLARQIGKLAAATAC
eukprot:6181398-Pleurochrysis_carterae.AAC.1